MSQNTVLHPASRLSGRAILGGFLVTIATFISLLALVAAVTGWSADLRELSMMGAGFWVGIFAAWIASVFTGGFVAARSIPASSRSGILNSTVVWAAATVFATWILVLATNEAFDFTRDGAAEPGTLRIVFFGNFIAAAGAIIAGNRRNAPGSARAADIRAGHARAVRDAHSRPVG